MKNLKLVRTNRVALIDDEDYLKCYIIHWGITSNGKRICSTNYKINNKYFNLSNFIMNNYTDIYDHRDRNFLNNQKENLRIANKSLNSLNRLKIQLNKGTSSIYKGVSFNKKGNIWEAYICMNGKKLNLGRYINELDAARAYDTYALKYFKEFAVLNFPKE